MVIEFDGEQHERPVTFGGMSKDRALKIYEETKQRDKLKNKYCKENNIELLRIPYSKLNSINKILKRKFNV